MNRSTPVIRALVTAGLGLSLGLAVAATALADGEGSGVVVTPAVVKPGDEILVQGHALWTELAVTVELVGRADATVVIGAGETAPDGSLFVALTLPADVAGGKYRVVVRNANGETADAPIVIEAETPILQIVVGVGAIAAGSLVGISIWRRRATKGSAAT
ncbi:MAG: hypothetical protein ABI573_07100 [Chloroflexota bacterium]